LNEAESWLDLAWQGLASSPAHRLRLVFGWPESADFVAARSGWEAAVLPLQTELQAVKVVVDTRDHELQVVKTLVDTRDHELQAVKDLVGTRDHELATRDGRIQAQAEHLEAQNRRLIAQEEQGKAQSAEISELSQSLEQRWAQIATLQTQVARLQTFSGWIKQPLRPLLKLIHH